MQRVSDRMEIPETKVVPVVAISDGWCDAGKIAIKLGEPIMVGQWWTPVLFDDEEDPCFFKTAGLTEIGNERREV